MKNVGGFVDMNTARANTDSDEMVTKLTEDHIKCMEKIWSNIVAEKLYGKERGIKMLLVGQYFKLKEELQDYLGLETGHRDYPIYDMREYYWCFGCNCIDYTVDEKLKEDISSLDFDKSLFVDHFMIAIETMYSEWGVYVFDNNKEVLDEKG